MERRFAHLRAKHVPAHADDVAAVEVVPVCKGLFADFVLANVELDAPGAILEIGKDGLAHFALGHQPSGEVPAFGLRGLTVFEKAVARDEFGGGRVDVVARLRERIVPARTQSGQIIASGRYEASFRFAQVVHPV